MKCLECSNPLETKDAKKFCSRSCSATFNNRNRVLTSKTKSKIRVGVLGFHAELPRSQYDYVCDKCLAAFTSYVYMRKSRSVRCKSCKRVVKRATKDARSILELSKRTITKLLKRANFGCVMCGWDRTTLDIHHILHRSKGGTDAHQNLIALCPNCHRLAHEGKYDLGILKTKTLDRTFPNWKDFYFPMGAMAQWRASGL